MMDDVVKVERICAASSDELAARIQKRVFPHWSSLERAELLVSVPSQSTVLHMLVSEVDRETKKNVAEAILEHAEEEERHQRLDPIQEQEFLNAQSYTYVRLPLRALLNEEFLRKQGVLSHPTGKGEKEEAGFQSSLKRDAEEHDRRQDQGLTEKRLGHDLRNPSTFEMIGLNCSIDRHNAFMITKQRQLHMSLTEDTYRELGVEACVARPHPKRMKAFEPESRYVACVNLNSKRFGKKHPGYERLHWALAKEREAAELVDVLMCSGNGPIDLESVEYACAEQRLLQRTNKSFTNVLQFNVPGFLECTLSPRTAEQGATACEDFFTYLGLVLGDVTFLNSNVTNGLFNSDLANEDQGSADVSVLSWEGLISERHLVHMLMVARRCVSRICASDGLNNAFAAIIATPLLHAPLAHLPSSPEHEFATRPCDRGGAFVLHGQDPLSVLVLDGDGTQAIHLQIAGRNK
ncbi:hypothetical protein FVE85_0307 [Porphyridium purpureum]|uniref:Uncharacterized protein n=1 Tax=Porphyridium purpureum TaxID=35688 RepID=A0A5J4YZQ6_PORPP|nr:hypothetical protein FVE85_0307 [Porphyridium purpureum]|eukprot:POR1290..scf208_2